MAALLRDFICRMITESGRYGINSKYLYPLTGGFFYAY